MIQQQAKRQILVAFALVVSAMICCLALTSLIGIRTLQSISNQQSVHAQSFVPAKRLTTAFEREILNARIFFIYFVTIQKPGSLEKGWQRYHNAEARLKEMSLLIDSYPELSNLRESAAKLRADIAIYGDALAATLNMVQGGEVKGPHYDAQVKEWAARGAVMVTDAGNLESLCFHSSELDTGNNLNKVSEGRQWISRILMASLLLNVAMTLYFVRKTRRALGSSKVSSPLIECEVQPI